MALSKPLPVQAEPRAAVCRPLRSGPAAARRGARQACRVALAERLATYSGAGVAGPEAGRHHFLHIDDFGREELLAMLRTSAEVKRRLQARDEAYKPFAGLTMSMIFTKPSMRTRLSFETVGRHPGGAPPAPQAQAG